MLQKCLILGLSVAAIAPGACAENRVITSVVRTDARTGKLVRRTLVSPAIVLQKNVLQEHETPPAQPQALTALIDEIALQNEVEAPLVHSVIQTESNYNPLAISNKGAQGLMQLIPSTARRFGVADSFDMQQNVQGGVKYLKYLIGLFHGDYARAVAAYNAGEAAVAKYGGVPPYKETRNYVAQVTRGLEARRKAFIPKSDPQDLVQSAQAVSPEIYNPVISSVGPDGRVFYRTP